MIDIYDGLALVGLIGLGAALWVALGWVAVLAFGSTVALVIGLIGARGRARAKKQRAGGK